MTPAPTDRVISQKVAEIMHDLFATFPTHKTLLLKKENIITQALRDTWNEAIKSEWEKISKWKPYLHFCCEWDGLLIDKGEAEFDCCICFSSALKKPEPEKTK